jgi:FMN-dependent oxidoreductase (nitrilotriacetate monooxygenase family)
MTCSPAELPRDSDQGSQLSAQEKIDMTHSSRKRLHLGAIITAGPGTGASGAWRYPSSEQFRFLDATYYQHIARTLERGKFDLIFFADKLAVPGRFPKSVEENLRSGSWGAAHPDPLLLLTSIAAATERIGLASTISTSYQSPFHVARALGTLDHLSHGRAAWNVVTSTEDSEAQNFGLEQQRERGTRYDLADEFLRVVFGLWDSWEDGAVVMDRDAGLVIDPTKVHPLNHEGRHFRVRGPLNLPRPVQGYPVIAQAGSSDQGRDFAARWSELIFTPQPILKSAKDFYDDIKSRAVNHGRDPNEVKVLPGALIIVGENEAIAREKDELLKSLIGMKSPQSALSSMLELDLSGFSPDTSATELLASRKVQGMQGHVDALAQIAKEGNLTLGELGERFAHSLTFARFAGSPAQVADQMETWFRAEACDGFIIRPSYLPGSMEEFVRLVVPELQRRGLFREEYEGTTLRQHLGLARPPHGSWRQRFSEPLVAPSSLSATA